MSYQTMTWARSLRTGSITVKAVLMAVANYADENGVCWPSQEQLANDVEASRHTVMRALDTLEAMGVLSRKRRHRGDGARSADRIILNLSRSELRSTEQRSREQRSNEQRNSDEPPKSQDATAEPIRESPIDTSSLRSDVSARATKPTPHSELEKVLDAEHVEAVIEYRKAKKTAFTAHMAKLLARQLAKWPDPNEAADEMMAANWISFKPAWLERRLADTRAQSPPQSQKLDPMMQALQRRYERNDDSEPGQGEIEASGGTVRRLPATGTGGY